MFCKMRTRVGRREAEVLYVVTRNREVHGHVVMPGSF